MDVKAPTKPTGNVGQNHEGEDEFNGEADDSPYNEDTNENDSQETSDDELSWYCVICNRPCLMSINANEDQELANGLKKSEVRETLFNAFELETEDGSTTSYNHLPMCQRCTLKCARLKQITTDIDNLDKEFNFIREQMAITIVNMVAVNDHFHLDYFDQNNPNYKRRQYKQDEIFKLHEFIFNQWVVRRPLNNRREYAPPLTPKRSTMIKAVPSASNMKASQSSSTGKMQTNTDETASNDSRNNTTLISITTPDDEQPSTSSGFREPGGSGSRMAGQGVKRVPPIKIKTLNISAVASTSRNFYQNNKKSFSRVQVQRATNFSNGDDFSYQNTKYEEQQTGEASDDEYEAYNNNNKTDNNELANWGQGDQDDESSHEDLMRKYEHLTSFEGGHFLEGSGGAYDETESLDNMEDDNSAIDGEIDYQQNAEGFYTCPYCSKQFIHKYPFRDHLKTHTGEGPTCHICHKIFPKSHNLMLHMRTHTGEKPFNCEVCNKGFADKSNLKVHMRVHTGERPYHCEQCGLSFVNSSRLVVHRRMHTGEKPFPCDLCQRAFSTSNQLHSHRKLHFSVPANNSNATVPRKRIRRRVAR